MISEVIGIILVILGLCSCIVLWVLSKKPTSQSEIKEVRRFKLDHEYDNKGFTEKGQSDGISKIPHESGFDLNESFAEDPYFSTSSNTHAPPDSGDNF